jgi:hypothetical protein
MDMWPGSHVQHVKPKQQTNKCQCQWDDILKFPQLSKIKWFGHNLVHVDGMIEICPALFALSYAGRRSDKYYETKLWVWMVVSWIVSL